MSAVRALLVLGVVLLSVFTAGKIFIAGLGSVRDLVTVYGATAALALSLAILFELKTRADENSSPTDLPGGKRSGSHRVSGVFTLGLQNGSAKGNSTSSFAVSSGRP